MIAYGLLLFEKYKNLKRAKIYDSFTINNTSSFVPNNAAVSVNNFSPKESNCIVFFNCQKVLDFMILLRGRGCYSNTERISNNILVFSFTIIIPN